MLVNNTSFSLFPPPVQHKNMEQSEEDEANRIVDQFALLDELSTTCRLGDEVPIDAIRFMRNLVLANAAVAPAHVVAHSTFHFAYIELFCACYRPCDLEQFPAKSTLDRLHRHFQPIVELSSWANARRGTREYVALQNDLRVNRLGETALLQHVDQLAQSGIAALPDTCCDSDSNFWLGQFFALSALVVAHLESTFEHRWQAHALRNRLVAFITSSTTAMTASARDSLRKLLDSTTPCLLGGDDEAVLLRALGDVRTRLIESSLRSFRRCWPKRIDALYAPYNAASSSTIDHAVGGAREFVREFGERNSGETIAASVVLRRLVRRVAQCLEERRTGGGRSVVRRVEFLHIIAEHLRQRLNEEAEEENRMPLED